MPGVVIEIRRSIPAEQESAIIAAVHSALREAFGLPPTDRNVRLVAHAPHRFACPPNLAHPELYTYVSIDAFSGRSRDAKRKLYALVVTNLERLGIPQDHVVVVLRETAPENWGIRGGQAACDLDLGFKIDV
jgi:phenylpyruvate tautomerase PptA (4-oxalocrotonate tautomerase family)